MEPKLYPQSLKSFIRQYKRLNENNWIKEIYTDEEISTDDCISYGELIENVCLCIPDLLKRKKITVVLDKKNTHFDINNQILYINISKSIENIILELIHELGHVVENQNPDILKKSLNLIETKSGKNIEDIKEALSNKESLWVEGKFIDPYVGKIYKDLKATEVISMGFQYLYKDEQDFSKRDPHHYSIIYRLLKYGKLTDE